VKILAICGSPRKGNSYSTLHAIKANYPDIEIKILRLSELNLEMCKGCYGCVLNGEEFCPVKDDRDMIIQEMVDADGLIVASPTYTVQISALMKIFFDRLGFFGHRPRFYDKFAMSISTGAGYGIDETNKYMSKILSSFGYNVAPSLDLQTLPKKLMSDRRKAENQKKTFLAFDTFVARINKGERDKPPIGLVVVFHLFKAVAEAFPDVYRADYEYYKDKTDYFYPTKIPFYKKMVANKYVKKVMKG
jgi:multimeric flavodoxin WrbA